MKIDKYRWTRLFLDDSSCSDFVPKKVAPCLGGGHDEIVKIDHGAVKAITDDLSSAEDQLVVR
jgi:hypothetical protein